jgi:hypothetical protein
MGDARHAMLHSYSADYVGIGIHPVHPATIQVDTLEGHLIALSMGQFTPTDVPRGQLSVIGKKGSSRVLLDSLRRPVHFAIEDMDKDGRQDVVVACFGKWMGGVYLYQNLGNFQFREIPLYQMPGAIKVEIADMNQDSWPDLLVLMGQGDEKIVYFSNQQGRGFELETLLRFPPMYGSTDIHLEDLDADGNPEILYTNGDNGDYVSPVKPYHGLSLFKGNVMNGFQRTYFQWIPGAYGVASGYLDKDEKKDLVVNAFFPDYREGRCFGLHLLFGKDQGFNHYARNDCKAGRWIKMELADTDKDGDLDILLGNLAFEAYPDSSYVKSWQQQGLPFMLIKNENNKKKSHLSKIK